LDINLSLNDVFLYSDMNVTEIIKEITVDDQFFDMLHCQNELLAGLSIDKPNNYIMSCMSKRDDLYKVFF
jgi:hypothetical protein